MKKMAIITMAVILLVAATVSAQPVVFADANLKAAVEGELGVSDPTPTDMLGLISFSSVYSEIADLTGLEYATNLTVLELYRNEITDITPLSGLTNLTFMNLQHNQISDITQLSGLTNMDYLDLADNQVADIGPLSGFSSLTHLRLGANQITDVGPLSGLTSLTELHIAGNQISNIGSLSSLVNLQSLDLGGNLISDMTPLAGLTNLQWLSLWGSQITAIPNLSALTALTELYLNNNQISDISGLSGLTSLTELLLHYNQISDITPLDGMTNLWRLWLRFNPLNCDAYRSVIPSIITNNPGIDIRYDPEPPGCSGLQGLIDLLMEAKEVIGNLPVESFHNKNSSKTLINKIDAVLIMIDEGFFEEALNKLKNDVLKKTDGCAETGAPDSNDWLITCETQAEVYPLISSAIEILGSLI